MTISIDRPAAEAAARTRLAELRRTLAEDRAARRRGLHEDVISLSSGHLVVAEAPPAVPGPVNYSPGPDFSLKVEAAA